MKTTSYYHMALIALLGIFLFFPEISHAQYLSNSADTHKPYLLAQVDPEEAYDPFTDYSEFDEESDEEADINFFRNGRFFTVGLAGGTRGFTGNFADAYGSAPTFGIFLSYFFDLRLALSIGFQTGDHGVGFTVNNGSKAYTGNVSLTAINFDLKYYLNTQNVTRGLADLNPYILAGLGQFYRTYTISGLDGFSRDSTMGFDVGAGLEIPLMRKKAYLGIQAAYHYVNFSDENKSYINNGSDRLDKNLTGDFYDFLFILGMNF